MNPREEIELRAGVQPIEELHAERRHLIEQGKQMAALYGRFGMWDARRKVMLALAARRVRERFNKAGKRPSAAIVDEMAHGDATYTAFIEQSVQEAGEWQVIQNEINTVTETINRDQALIRFGAMEPK